VDRHERHIVDRRGVTPEGGQVGHAGIHQRARIKVAAPAQHLFHALIAIVIVAMVCL
jgi:hypothetical protein